MGKGILAGALLLGALAARAGEPTAHRTRVLRVWDDTVKDAGVDVVRHVEVVFDYTDAVARELVFDAAGKLHATRELRDEPPRPSREEFEEAIAIVMADPELGEMVRRTGGIFEGGFLMTNEAGQCGAGTRCVEVQILDRGRYAAIRKVIVDLVAQRIAIRAHWPAQLVLGPEGSR